MEEPLNIMTRGMSSTEGRRVGRCGEGRHSSVQINDICYFTNYHKLDLVNICQACKKSAWRIDFSVAPGKEIIGVSFLVYIFSRNTQRLN